MRLLLALLPGRRPLYALTATSALCVAGIVTVKAIDRAVARAIDTMAGVED